MDGLRSADDLDCEQGNGKEPARHVGGRDAALAPGEGDVALQLAQRVSSGQGMAAILILRKYLICLRKWFPILYGARGTVARRKTADFRP